MKMSSRKRCHDGDVFHESAINDSNCSKRLCRSSYNNLRNINNESEISGCSIKNSQIENYDNTIRCGKIRRISLENFMCHENLKFEFHNRINFVVGTNGSGKSAVMTAIVLCLGGNARLTNRSTSIQKFIRNGQSSAKIEIELENGGRLAFKREIYGNRITVVRTIRISGSSSYALKDCHGKVVSTKLDDLRHMLLFFGIRVENPIFMLNQDKAREFLKDLEPKKNYELFLKAGYHDLVIEGLHVCRSSISEQQSQLATIRMRIDSERNEIEEMEKKLQICKNLRKMKKHLQKLEISYMWHFVVALEKEIEHIKESIDKEKEELQSLNEYSMSNETKAEDLNIQIRNKQTNLDALQEQHDDLQRKLHSAQEEIISINAQLNSINLSLNNYEKRIDYERANLDQLNSHMQNINENKEKNKQLLEQNEQKMQRLQEEHVKKCEDLKIEEQKLEKIRSDLETSRDNNLKIKQSIAVLLKNINNINGDVSTLKVNSCNKLAIYGRNMVGFVADIEELHKRGQFSQMPRGPVGRYIKVPNEKYRNIVEHVLRPRLHSFIVNSDKDRVLLNNILKTKYPDIKYPIIKTQFMKQVYNVTKGRVRPPPNTTLLMDLISCSDPVVMNLLIDIVRIETILITDSKQLAEELTSSLENVPPNLSSVLVPEMKLEYVPAPHYGMYSQNIKNASLIQVDVNDRINQLLIEKNTAEKNANIKQISLQETDRDIKELQMKCQKQRSLIETKKHTICSILEQKKELENFDYPQNLDYDILKAEHKEKQETLKGLIEKSSNGSKQLNEINAVKDKKAQVVADIKKSLQKLEEDIKKEQLEYEAIQLKLREVDYNMQGFDRKIKILKDTMMNGEKNLKAAEKNYQKKKSEALRKGKYIPTNKSEEWHIQTKKALELKIQQYENLNIDTEQLRVDLTFKKELLNEKCYKVEKISELVKALGERISSRYQFLTRMLSHTSLCVNQVFMDTCRYRNIQGSLEISHYNKTIDISVTPRADQINDAGRMSTTRVLSGGERSFTTVALLLALWSNTNHPFYFLDEYDVFTDEINRQYITELLIQEGERNPNRQYFFLTPQDTTIRKSDAIQIHKLAEPVRYD